MIEEYFDKIAVWLSFNDVILLNVYSNMDRRSSNTISTIGLNTLSSIPVLEYNEEWLSGCSYEHFEFIIINELFKLLLKHPTSRLLDPREISAMASNITICELTTPNIIIQDFSAANYGLESGLNFEKYWKLLQDGKDEAGTSLLVSNKLDNSLQQYLDPNSNANQNWGENDLIEELVSNIVDEASNNQKQWGTLSGKIQSQILEANRLKIDPMSVLKRFKSTINTLDTIPSRMKYNRRYGLSMPGRRKRKKSNVLVAIDVSGSMTDEMVKDGIKLINTIITNASVEYLTFDTKITCEPIKTIKKIGNIDINGRGGTNIKCVIDYIIETRNKYDGVIVYSDNDYQQVSTQPRNVKFLWFGCRGASKSPQQYGLHLQLDEI